MTTIATLYVSAILNSLCSTEFDLCCLFDNVPLPMNSDLCKLIILSTITNFIFFSSMYFPIDCTINSKWAELYTFVTTTFCRTSFGSNPFPSAICTSLSGLNVDSVSMYNAFPPNPFSSGDC